MVLNETSLQDDRLQEIYRCGLVVKSAVVRSIDLEASEIPVDPLSHR